MKKIDVLGYIILVCMLCSNYYIFDALSSIRTDLKENGIPKLAIVDLDQFDNICEQFKTQWGVEDYVVYILQPNSKFKTHKELVTTTIPNAPLKLPIFRYNDIFKEKINYYVGDEFSFGKVTDCEFNLNSKFVMIPIYRYNVIIGEMYILVDDDKINQDYSIKVEEAQVLEHLIK